MSWYAQTSDNQGLDIFVQRYDAANQLVGSTVRQQGMMGNLWDWSPKVAALNDGGYVLTWWGDTSTGQSYEIFWQRYDGSNNAVGSEQQLHGISGNLSDELPQITALADGGFVMAWQGQTNDSELLDIFVQRYDAANQVVGSLQRLSGMTGGLHDSHVQIAGLIDGGYVVTWRGNTSNGNSYDIFIQRFDASNNLVGSQQQLHGQSGLMPDISPKIVALNDGGYVVAWQGYTSDGSNYDIFVQRFDANNIPVGSLQQLSGVNGNFADWSPQIAAFSDAGYVVTWYGATSDGQNDDIFVQQFDAANQKVGAVKRLQGMAGNYADQNPQVTVLHDEMTHAVIGYVVTWEGGTGDGQNSDIFVQRYDASGNPITANLVIDTVCPNASASPIVPEGAGGINAAEAADGVTVTVSLAGTQAKAGDTLRIHWGGEIIEHSLIGTDINNGVVNIVVNYTNIVAQGDGSLSVTSEIIDQAGNIGALSPATTVTVDTQAPTATINMSDTALAVGETSTVTITFNEAVTAFNSDDDVTVQNGTLSLMTSSDGGITWTGIFTPTTDTEDTSNLISLADTYTDLAGNDGSTADSANYSIDTLTPLINNISITGATGIQNNTLNAGDTLSITVTFSENVTVGAVQRLYGMAGALDDYGQQITALADGGYAIAWYGNTSDDQYYDIFIQRFDSSGNPYQKTFDLIIDATAPTANITLSDTALAAGETSTVTITFSEAVTAFNSDDDVTVQNGSLSLMTSSDGGITWTGTFTPTTDTEDASRGLCHYW